MNAPASESVIVIGAGNIGSRALELIARMPDVGHIGIFDGDTYDESNLTTQAIAQGDVGQPKALAQSIRLLAIRPDLRVQAFVRRVEDAPLGWLRGSRAILGCVDSLEARRVINQIATRLGIPWIDAGVMADFRLVRISVNIPGEDLPCAECAFSDASYTRLEQRFACGGTNATPSSGAPSYLGGMAAALQVAELRKVLDGEFEAGRELIYDVNNQRAQTTTFRRNPSCRFDHARWDIQPLGRGVTGLSIGELFAAADAGELRADNALFVTRVGCAACGAQIETVRIRSRANGSTPRCPSCGGRCEPIGYFTFDALRRDALAPGQLGESAMDAGFMDGDVLCAGSGGREHYLELGNNEPAHD